MAQPSPPAIVAHASSLSSPGVTEPPLALTRLTLSRPWSPTGSHRAKWRHCSARARGRTHQLCDRSTPLPRSAPPTVQIAVVAFRRSQTGETVRGDRARPGKPKHRRPRDFVRPGHRSMAARLRPAQATALTASSDSFRSAPLAKLAGLADQAQFRPTLRRHAARGTAERAHAPIASQFSRSALAAKSQRKLGAGSRSAPTIYGGRLRPKSRCGARRNIPPRAIVRRLPPT